ncbi:TPA: hypothetical protein ACGIK9_003380 [Acinetobacter baumannii]|uniref:hypothetical protein n=1 Tax=Acinetobacter baumannii TaxID=470 RepID=UPI00338FFA03
MSTTCDLIVLKKKAISGPLDLNELWMNMVKIFLESGIGLETSEIHTPFLLSPNMEKFHKSYYGSMTLKVDHSSPYKEALFVYCETNRGQDCDISSIDTLQDKVDFDITEFVRFSLPYKAQNLEVFRKVLIRLLDEDDYFIAFTPDDALDPELVDQAQIDKLKTRIDNLIAV